MSIRSSTISSNPMWNEDLVFVAAEPFEPFLTITVEDLTNGQTIGCAKMQVATINKRTEDKSDPRSRWFNLIGDDQTNKPYGGRIHVWVRLEEGYHMLDEAANVTSDVRATAKQSSKPAMGLLEVGIREDTNLLPVNSVKMKDGTCNAALLFIVTVLNDQCD
ncbi:QUIRKY [Olea europaea subsp. europaea]|uniref:QUIRKY n=1 Tax=Olea europaea subsp. europaea TaxID=158383 RepID=A0A8S0PTE4_OLEEU|nr:QUIRKY [Olea europaea subsp. europaea]